MRFLGVTWNVSDPSQAQAVQLISHRLNSSRHWSCPVEQNGFKLFYYDVQPTSARALVLDGQAGAVLGTLFRSQARKTQLSPLECAWILASKGRWLIEHCSGRYVLLLRDPATGDVRVLRDPTGGIRCLHTRYRNAHIFVSCMTDCTDAGLNEFPIDWNYMHAHLVTPNIQSRETALHGVMEVQRGECVHIADGKLSRQWYWHPFTIVESGRIETVERATDAVREATLASVHAWAGCHDTIMLKLSGGLDSSTIAACLSTAPSRPDVIAVHHYTPGPKSDERAFVRLVADRMGLPLIQELFLDNYALSEAFLSDRPGFYLSSYPAIVRRARELGAVAIYDGTGGDEFFIQHHNHYAAANYLALYGLRPELFRIAHDVALQQNVTIWAILWRALLQNTLKPAMNPQRERHKHNVLVSSEVRNTVIRTNAFFHPWFESAQRTLPGSWWHIYALSLSTATENPRRAPGDPENISPFFNQKLMETVLRIPMHLHTAGGWDRVIERRAFADMLPAQITARYQKADIEAPVGAIVSTQLNRLRETLLNGQLVQRGLLHRPSVERALSGQPSDVSPLNAQIIELYSIELWLAQWQSVAKRAAA